MSRIQFIKGKFSKVQHTDTVTKGVYDVHAYALVGGLHRSRLALSHDIPGSELFDKLARTHEMAFKSVFLAIPDDVTPPLTLVQPDDEVTMSVADYETLIELAEAGTKRIPWERKEAAQRLFQIVSRTRVNG